MYDKPVLIDDLLGESHIDYDTKKLCAIYIPADEVLRRTKYEWFARMSVEQVLVSGSMIAKYLLLSMGQAK